MGGKCSRISGRTPEARSRLCVCRASFLMTFVMSGMPHRLLASNLCALLVIFSLYVSPFSSVQSLSHATPWTAACQASLSITNSRSVLKLMSIELVMPSNCLILCHFLFLPPSIFPSIGVFSSESALRIRLPKY